MKTWIFVEDNFRVDYFTWIPIREFELEIFILIF